LPHLALKIIKMKKGWGMTLFFDLFSEKKATGSG
jgi:hypothetical protein